MDKINHVLSPYDGRPHVFVLGAGASRAACPKGDVRGCTLPLMNDLVDVAGLGSVFKEYGVAHETRDFEALYSELAASGRHQELLAELEGTVFAYFASLSLPDTPTLYDHLVLSLRPKDMIATFNWDPLLWQALMRNAERFGPGILPAALHLHGNVAIGYCGRHKPATLGDRRSRCLKCGSGFVPIRLLYPVTKKNYSDDPSIATPWKEFQRFLKHAYILTIFGYSAPETDVKAIEMMKQGWGDPASRGLEQTEIIDIRPENELLENWKPFIHTHHYLTTESFYDCFAARHPRRSCEDLWEAVMQLYPQPDRRIPRLADWGQVENWVRPLLEQEREYDEKQKQRGGN